jgi:hypothetical protein
MDSTQYEPAVSFFGRLVRPPRVSATSRSRSPDSTNETADCLHRVRLSTNPGSIFSRPNWLIMTGQFGSEARSPTKPHITTSSRSRFAGSWATQAAKLSKTLCSRRPLVSPETADIVSLFMSCLGGLKHAPTLNEFHGGKCLRIDRLSKRPSQ